MSSMMDKLRLPQDLGRAIREHRRSRKLKAVEVARHAGRSRDVLHRLEQGGDVSVASLMDLLRAMDLCIRLEPAGLPTLEEMQRRFGADDDEGDDAA
jgi:HTH-type transcriptional regulator / antitoxin HipB